MDIQRKTEIAKKIKALLAKTVQAGCTEQEAFTAFELAQRLISEYQIDLTEAELIEEGFSTFALDWTSEKRQFIEDRLVVAIGKFTDCKPLRVVNSSCFGKGKKTKKGSYKLVFYGFKSDVAFASWLISSLISFAENSAEAHVLYELGEEYSLKQQKEAWRAYVEGLCDRIRKRLAELKQAPKVKTGNAVAIINKVQLIEQYLNEHGVKTKPGNKLSTNLDNEESFYAGYRRGEEAGLNRPINNGHGTRLIK